MRTVLAAVLTLASAAPATGRDLPFLLFDTHVHFYTSDLAKFPLHAEHAYMGEARMRDTALHDADSRQRVFHDWDANGVQAGVGIQYGAAYAADNAYLLAVAASSHARVTPVVIVDSDDPAAPDRLVALVHQAHVAGFRQLGQRSPDGLYPWLTTPGMLKLWSVADAHHLAVELMAYPRSPDANFLALIGQLADRFAHARIVLDHVAWPDPAGAPDYGLTQPFQALAAHRNVYVKLTTENFARLSDDPAAMAGFVQRAVAVFGADHVMWGSDKGNTMIPYDRMVRQAIESTALLSARDRRMVLRETGRTVFAAGR